MKPHRIKTISEYHRHLGLPKPEHPLISVVTLDGLALPLVHGASVTFDFYFMGLKRMKGVQFKYGQHIRDYDESLLFFMAPKQVLSFEKMAEMPEAPSGFLLLIHPDFLWNTTLGKNIKQYEFFDYAVNEGLFLTDKEQDKINSLVKDISQEYAGNMDNFSQDIILSHVETLLNYSQRYYHRQFLIRKKNYSQILDRLEKLLNDYFAQDIPGLPTVAYLAKNLNVSPSYLSSMLRSLTGQNTQQHIHNKLIEKAKEKLSTTDLSVSEIAYTLGFEHLQSFSKLFKSKTSLSPLAFRASIN